jgi:hypothetical protein
VYLPFNNDKKENKMASITRVNGLGHAHATLYSTANLGFYFINGDGSAGSLAGQGGIGGALEAIAQALQPLAMDSESTSGKVNIIVDNSQNDAASLQVRLRALGTVNGYNFSAGTVTVGGEFIVSA